MIHYSNSLYYYYMINIMEPLPLPHLHHKEEVLNRALTAPKVSLITSCSLSPTSPTNIITDDDSQWGVEKSPLLHLVNNNLSALGGNNHEPTLRTYSRINELPSIDVTDDENVGETKKTEEGIIENDNLSSEPIPHIIATITIDDARSISPSTLPSHHLIKHQQISLPRLEVIDDCDSGPGPLPQMMYILSCNEVAAIIEERATTKKSPSICRKSSIDLPAGGNVVQDHRDQIRSNPRGRDYASAAPPVTEIVIERRR